MSAQAYEGWAVVELMGHRQRPGRIAEVEMYGGKLLRVDIPMEGGDVTEFYGVASIYSVRPVAEDVARDMAKRIYDMRPVRPVEYRLEHKDGLATQASPPPRQHEDDYDDDEHPF
jgi:hypothetical protein